MAISASRDTIRAGTTAGRFIYQTSTTASSDSWEYYNPIQRWLIVRDELEEASARQRQRAAWFAPQKVRVMAPVPPPVRRYQKMFQKHLFAPGRKK